MIGQALTIAAAAEAILAAVEEHFAGGPDPLPARRVIVGGDTRIIAWDCEQVSVALVAIGVGPLPTAQPAPVPTPQQLSAAGVRHAVFEVQIVRCAPTMTDGGDPPPADTITAAGLLAMRDAGRLSQALVEACTRLRAGLDTLSPATVTAGGVEPLGPLGDHQAVAGSVAIAAMGLV